MSNPLDIPRIRSYSETLTGARIWTEYARDPDRQLNIPNCSYAGYQCGDMPIPEPPTTVNAMDHGARGDGRTDDTEAIQSAVNKAGEHGGAVLIPEGRYRLDGMIHIGHSNVVLRGEGDKTTLVFSRPLLDIAAQGRLPNTLFTHWSWMGGLIWVSPNMPPIQSDDIGRSEREKSPEQSWQTAPETGAAMPARRGDCVVKTDLKDPIKRSEFIVITWHNDSGDSLLHSMAGHALMRQYPWRTPPYAMQNIETFKWIWVVEVESVFQNEIRLRQPLRLDIRPEWNVKINRLAVSVRESGVENLCLEMPEHPSRPHCQDAGYNGVYFNQSVHCWARNIKLVNTDCGINVASAKNTSICNVHASGQDIHHFTTTRTFAHDNLFEDFLLESKPMHGLNTEGFSSGNVWHRGEMRHGTFDSHRGMSFDMIHTDITLPNDGCCGGNLHAGPLLGARCVRWNIRLTTPRSQIIYQPDVISDGALAGIQGADLCADSAHYHNSDKILMMPGDKNCLVADHGKTPDPENLYKAQLALRHKTI